MSEAPGVLLLSLLLSNLELIDVKVYAPYIRALLGTASQFCEVVALKSTPVGIAFGVASSEAPGTPWALLLCRTCGEAYPEPWRVEKGNPMQHQATPVRSPKPAKPCPYMYTGASLMRNNPMSLRTAYHRI